MFVGHLAVALGAKSAEPRLPLGAAVAASFGIDLLWPILLLLGVETVRVQPGDTAFTPLAFESYPWSHSLLMVAVWAAVAGLLGGRLLESNRVGWMLAGLVLSHWVLDLVTHRPDLPLWPGGPVYGFGLWQSVGATLAVEAGLLVTGLVMYSRKTSASDRTGTLALYSLLALCVVIWVSGPFSPPPPNAGAVAGVALALWLLPFWSWWAERHRTARA